MHNLHDELKVL